MNEKHLKLNIGLLSLSATLSGLTPLTHLLDIVKSNANDIFLVTGNFAYLKFRDDPKIKVYGSYHQSSSNPLFRAINYFITQLKFSYDLVKISRNVDYWLFFIGGDTLVLPMFAAKLMRKKVILIFAGSSIETLAASNDKFVNIIKLFSRINKLLADNIIVYSKNSIKSLDIEKYNEKILIANRHFINFEIFNKMKEIKDRPNIIAFVGRLSEEKGVLNFVKSIKILRNKDPKLIFYIVGEGELREVIEDYIKENDLNSNVKLIGWIKHDKMAYYLNNFKLLVLPSYTEGLPNIILESMACGTPVLASSVGSIPDIIQDQINGFLMYDVSEKHISEKVYQIMNFSSLDKVSENEINYVQEKFEYNAIHDKWKKLLWGFKCFHSK